MGRLADPELAERRRTQILHAAERCFRRRGFHQTSMAEICAEAELSAGALYRYFGSKADIIIAIADVDQHDVAALLINAEGGEHLVDALCRVARHVFARFFSGEGAPLAADVMAEAARDEMLARRLDEQQQRVIAGVAGAIRAAPYDCLAKTDPERAARVLVATIDGIGMRLALGARGRGDVDAAVADFRLIAAALFSSGAANANITPSRRSAGKKIAP
jgi:AcrR family transcriptional regulator